MRFMRTQQCALAATRWPDHGRDLAVVDRKADIEQRLLLPIVEIEIRDAGANRPVDLQ